MDPVANEFSVLEQICRPGKQDDARVVIGPGDDLALVWTVAPGGDVDLQSGSLLLAGVDQLIDGIHVSLKDVGLKAAGRKAITRSLSDIAAMAGRPVATLVSAVVPVGMSGAEALELFESMKQVAAHYHAPLVGGDLAYHQDEHGVLNCSVTVLAVPPSDGAIERFGSKAGDGLYVTGKLGGAWQGAHHLTFEPRLAEASMLKAILGERLHAMIDISDGLGRDASHLVERSGLQVVLEGELLPCRDGSDLIGAVQDGEDYELLFTASGDVPEGLGACSVTRIGSIRERDTADEPSVLLLHDGEEHDVSCSGWEHGAK